MMTLRPFGPSVTFTAFASLVMPRFMASRASWSNAICLALISLTSSGGGLCRWVVDDWLAASRGERLSEHTKDVAFVHQQDVAFGAAVLELVAGPRGEQHL